MTSAAEAADVGDFVQHLQDVEARSGEDAEFMCVLAKKDVVTNWKHNGREIAEAGDKHKATSHGMIQTLRIKNVDKSDAGEYGIRTSNDVESKATLNVRNGEYKGILIRLTLKTF